METKLIVTDVTQMGGTRICMGGITDDWECIRPVLPYPGLQESMLYLEEDQVIQPFSRITLDLFNHTEDPPHTEDWEFTSKILDYRGELPERHRVKFLEKILDPSVASIFGTKIHEVNDRCYVDYGTGTRSLGTIKVGYLENVNIINYNGSYWYGISFRDGSGKSYCMNITDLAFRYFVRQLIREGHNYFPKISEIIEEKLSGCEIYLRIGLGRRWHPDKTKPRNRCYLFITGLYSFPDYLEGKSFTDFKDGVEDYPEENHEIPF